MVDQQKTTLSKIKAAYGLNAQEAETLLNALFPDGVFPYEIWRQAYEKWGMADGLDCGQARQPGLQYLPENVCPTRMYAIQLVAALIDPARLHKLSALEEGFAAVIQATYEDMPFPFSKEKEALFRLMRDESKEFHKQKSSPAAWKIHHPLTVEYDFIHKMFPDTLVVNKAAAVRHLHSCGYPLRREVKGISPALVEKIIAASATQSEASPAQPQEDATPQAHGSTQTVRVSRSLWEGKTPEDICAAMRQSRHPDEVIAHVLYNWRGFRNKTEIGRLLGPASQEDSSCRKRTDRLLAAASRLNIVDS